MRNEQDIKTENRVASNESFFRQITDNIQEVLFLISTDWSTVFYVSPTYEKIWGKSCESLLESPFSWLDSIHPHDHLAVSQYIAGVGNNIKAEINFPHYRVIKPDGSTKWIKARGFPVLNDSGEIYRIAGIAEDITEQKRKEAELLLSKERLKMVLEGSQQGFWDWNIATGEVQRNERWAEMLGYTLKEFEANTDSWTDSIYPDDRDRAWASINDHLEGRTDAHNLEYRMLTKGGGYKWIHDQARIVQRDDNGRPLRMSGTHTDITDKVRAEELLRLSQQRSLLYREQSPIGIIEWNADYEFIDWNPAAEKIFGYTKTELSDKKVLNQITPESALSASKLDSTSNVNENITKDGRTILCEWHNTQLKDQNGNVIGITSLVEDVTQRQKNEEDLRHAQKMDAIGKLTGGIAHDFNNMLGVILGFSQLQQNRLDESDADPKLKKYCDEIMNAGERAKKLTSKLLEFSRKAASLDEVVDINSILLGMQHLLEKTLTPRIELVLELEEKLWPVWLDKARLEDSLLNISINAMHAMPEGGILKVHTGNMSLENPKMLNLNLTSGDYVLLSVSDTGVGMTREIQQKIFDPFFTTKGEAGTGLGMSQVYGFVTQMGGDIQLYSEPDIGTRVTIYIPRLIETDIVRSDRDEVRLIESEPGQETILVVDDELALLDLTQEILASNGYKVFIAENAQSALALLKNEVIDLIVSDVIMPGMDGYQLAAEVEKLFPNMPVQLVSGFSDDQHIQSTNEKLRRQLIQKPYKMTELLNRVRLILDESKKVNVTSTSC